MPRIRSLLTAARVEVAQRAHNCQGNSAHRLVKGDRRLAVKNERGWDYYCLDCGGKILERDSARIRSIMEIIDSGGVTTGDAVD